MMSFVINCTSFKAYRDQLKLTASNLWNRKEELVLNFKLISFIRHFGHGALKWKEMDNMIGPLVNQLVQLN